MVLAATLVSANAYGQAKISTKKVKISDFTTRTTKVVLGGNDMTDGALKEEVSARWRISPFEFCTVEEYRKLKDNPSYYFLLTAVSANSKDSGILSLTLHKGGAEDAEDPNKRPVEVASLPLCARSFPSGREMTFIPAILEIMQDYVSKAVLSDKAGYMGFDSYRKNILSSAHKRIFFSKDDLSPGLDTSGFDEDMLIVSEEEADSVFAKKSYNTLVSFVVAPSEAQPGANCYKMLIDADTYELYWFSHHGISFSSGAGFTKKDIKAITAPRKKRRK